MEIIFATNNPNKLREAQAIVHQGIDIIGLKSLGFDEEIPETHDTLEENALEKAQFIHSRYQLSCFSEDTGLEVDCLGGEPGVYSARYAGENCSPDDNIQLLLHNMKDCNSRKAKFRTVVSLILDNKKYYFEGEVNGRVLTEPKGSGGFGYDPIFAAEGSELSFAQIDSAEKNRISHRGKAISQLVLFLNDYLMKK